MSKSDAEFMQAFGFTEEDLLANRRGKMSPSQKEKTLKHGRIVFAVFAGVGLLLAISLNSDFIKKQVYISQATIFFCLAVFVVFSLVGFALFWSIRSATKPGALMGASGKVFFEPDGYKALRLCIGGFRLRVKDPAVKDLFIPDTEYDVYFSQWLGARLGIIFSVETTKNHT